MGPGSSMEATTGWPPVALSTYACKHHPWPQWDVISSHSWDPPTGNSRGQQQKWNAKGRCCLFWGSNKGRFAWVRKSLKTFIHSSSLSFYEVCFLGGSCFSISVTGNQIGCTLLHAIKSNPLAMAGQFRRPAVSSTRCVHWNQFHILGFYFISSLEFQLGFQYCFKK